MEASRNSFSFFVSYIEAVEELPEKEQLATLKAIIKYALYDKEPENFKGIKQAVFLLVKPTLDKSKQKAANGKQKGSKRKANESKPEANGKQDSILPSIGIGGGEGEGEGEGEGIGVGEREGDNSAHAEGALFTSFWNAYPESARGEREAAWEAWKKLNPTEDKAAQIMEYLGYWKNSQRWVSDGGAFIPAAKNFLTPEKSYMRTKPAQAKGSVWGSCTLGAAEENAIRRALDEDEVKAIHRMMEKPIYAEDVMSE